MLLRCYVGLVADAVDVVMLGSFFVVLYSCVCVCVLLKVLEDLECWCVSRSSAWVRSQTIIDVLRVVGEVLVAMQWMGSTFLSAHRDDFLAYRFKFCSSIDPLWISGH